jgi:hypothetical protein
MATQHQHIGAALTSILRLGLLSFHTHVGYSDENPECALSFLHTTLAMENGNGPSQTQEGAAVQEINDLSLARPDIP